MDDLKFVVAKLKADGKGRWEAVSHETGIPLNTLLKIAREHTKNPRYSTLQPLVTYYRKVDEAAA